MTQAKFWKDPPTEPLRDWRTYLIGVPVLSSSLGACFFMALSFSFTELAAIPPHIKVGLVIVAAFATAIGSAFGSIGSGIEIYAKAFEKRAIWLDWLSLILSVLATLGGFVMGFSALLGATSEWTEVAQRVGPVMLSALVALDSAGDLIELGGLFAAYNERYAAWLEEKRQYDQAHGLTEPVALKRANMSDLRRVVGRMNGERAKLTAAQLADALAEDGVEAGSPSTLGRWAGMVRNGKVN